MYHRLQAGAEIHWNFGGPSIQHREIDEAITLGTGDLVNGLPLQPIPGLRNIDRLTVLNHFLQALLWRGAFD